MLRDRDAVVVLLEGDGLRPGPHRRPELERALAQQRLQDVLVDEDAHGRAEPLDALVELLDVRCELASGQRLDSDDSACRAVRLQGLRAHARFEPELPQQLHRPQLEVARPWMDRGAGMALHRQRRHPVVAEQRGGRQAHQAAADDQDRDLLGRHGATLADACVMLARRPTRCQRPDDVGISRPRTPRT